MRVIDHSCDAPRHERRGAGIRRPDRTAGRRLRADDRIAAVFLGGSRARGEADEHSDIDLCLIVRDDAYEEVIADARGVRPKVGEPLFLENFGNENMAFVILAGGAELEFHFFRVRRSAPHPIWAASGAPGRGRDPGRARVPLPEVDLAARVESLRGVLFWFWHDLGHFTTAIGRDQLWWAAGQLEQLRAYCVNLARIEHGGESQDEAYWKLDEEVATEPLEPLRSTFVAMERDAMLRAAGEILAFFRERAPRVAEANGLAYPTELDHLVGGQFQDLR